MITTMTLDFDTFGMAEGLIPLSKGLQSAILSDFYPDITEAEQAALLQKGLADKTVKVSMTLDTSELVQAAESEMSLTYAEAVEYVNKMFAKARLNITRLTNPDDPDPKTRIIMNNGRSLTFEIPLSEFKSVGLANNTPVVALDGLIGITDDGEFGYVSAFENFNVVNGMTQYLSVIATFQMGTDFGFSTQENRTFHAQSSENPHPIEFTHNKTMGEQQYYHVKNKPYTVLEGVVDTRTIRSKKNYQEVL